MNNLKTFVLLLLTTTLFTSCFEDLDDNQASNISINDFVYRGMNIHYLYRDSVPDLAVDRFSNDGEFRNYLESYAAPEDLFESLIYNRQTVDRFSWITDDYIALEQAFSGVTKRTGLEFDFYYQPGSSSNVFGIIRLVLENSPAATNNLQRGQIFNMVNGTPLTASNYRDLLSDDSYTLHFATYNDNGTPNDISDDSIESTTETSTLTKVPYTENPVYKTEILQLNNQNIGYLMYNGFTADFNTHLNNAFAEFQTSNIQNLVLDLRYNPGGSVNTATLLGSMITGQFNGEIFAKLKYNSFLENNNSEYRFVSSFNGNNINSLNLQKVYILTTGTSASASEMVINSLNAYAPQIEVVHIGQKTTGKSQASITIYDSPDFGRSGAYPYHTYAMQPLVAKTVNKLDVSVPSSGLTPTISLKENPANYGVLGDVNEPLLAAALQHITENGRVAFPEPNNFQRLKRDMNHNAFEKGMYLD